MNLDELKHRRDLVGSKVNLAAAMLEQVLKPRLSGRRQREVSGYLIDIQKLLSSVDELLQAKRPNLEKISYVLDLVDLELPVFDDCLELIERDEVMMAVSLRLYRDRFEKYLDSFTESDLASQASMAANILSRIREVLNSDQWTVAEGIKAMRLLKSAPYWDLLLGAAL